MSSTSAVSATSTNSEPATPGSQTDGAGYDAKSSAEITVEFLDQGGFFDVPIQVRQHASPGVSCTHRLAEPDRALQEASTRLGVGLTFLKAICRRNGIPRWPYRWRRKIRNTISHFTAVLEQEEAEGMQVEYMIRQIAKMQKKIQDKLPH